jgi:hypothetical protein
VGCQALDAVLGQGKFPFRFPRVGGLMLRVLVGIAGLLLGAVVLGGLLWGVSGLNGLGGLDIRVNYAGQVIGFTLAALLLVGGLACLLSPRRHP